MSHTTMELNQNLRRLMDDRGLTVREVSQETGISRSTLSDWLAGAIPRDLHEVRRLARYFKVPFETMVFGDTDFSDVLNALQTEGIFEGLVRVRLERVLPPKPPKEKSK